MQKVTSTNLVKVPLQSLTKTGKHYFAYMRRSTTKKEQASSLPQQEEGIEIIAKVLGVNSSEIASFTESKSGYENRKRPEWLKLIREIDKLTEPCIILCRDTSRLSRNPTDNLEIANRIFGDNKQKKVIEAIYYLGTGMKVEKWDDKTNKKYIVETLHQNYIDSMENKEKCIGGILLKLDAGEFPYHPPHGLSRVNIHGLKRTSRSEKTLLKQNERIPFIRHAFEMKEKGKTAKEICKYLKQYGNINISGKNLVETIFANTVYKGVYTEKTTGTVFENIRFFEGKPPINNELWENANKKIGKRGSGFGEGQIEHIAPGILKHESGKNLSLYKAKGIYNVYQTDIKGNDGKRKSVGITEKELIKIFLAEFIPKIKHAYFYLANNYSPTDKISALELLTKEEQKDTLIRINQNYKDIYKETGDETYNLHFPTFNKYKKYVIERQEKYIDINFQSYLSQTEITDILDDIDKLFQENTDITQEEAQSLKDEIISNIHKSQDAKIRLKGLLTKTQSFELDQQEKQIRNEKKVELEYKKQSLEEEKKQIDKKAFKLGYSADIANEMKEDTEKEIIELQNQINLLSECTDMEKYIERLPEILNKLHELTNGVLTDTELNTSRQDIKQLIEIVSHELILTNKKELKIKLSEVLENLEIFNIGSGATSRARTCDLLLRREAL